MKLPWGIVAVIVASAVAQNVTQQQELQRAVQLIGTMPECARSCLLQAVAASGVSGANVNLASSCANKTATARVEACAMDSCTIRQQLVAKNITETLCRRPEREAPTISIASIVGGSFAAVAFIMRLLSKISFPCERGVRIDADLWWDDVTITLAMLLIIPITALSNVLTKLGIGKDVWAIPHENITEALRFYYADEILYLTALPVIKIAILCTYLRIFQTQQFRKLVFVAIGLNVAYAITFVLITAFQCTPVQLAWTHWDQEQTGHCNNINAQSWASAAFNIILDILVVGLPMPMLWRMNLNSRKKMLVMLMFGVGFFVTFVSILRLRLLVKFGDSKNISYDYREIGYWTIVELDTAMVCACMPGIRNLIRRAFPKLMGQSMGASMRSATPGGLSGSTAVRSGLEKDGTEVYVRPRDSEDNTFIPLCDVRSHSQYPSSHNLSTHETASAQVAPGHIRNFSHPVSVEHTIWRPVSPAEPDADWGKKF